MTTQKAIQVGLWTVAGSVIVPVIGFFMICLSLLFGAGNEVAIHIIWWTLSIFVVVFVVGAVISVAAAFGFLFSKWEWFVESLEIVFGPRGPQNIIGLAIGLLIILAGLALAAGGDIELGRAFVNDGLTVIKFITALAVFNFIWDHYLIHRWSKIRGK